MARTEIIWNESAEALAALRDAETNPKIHQRLAALVLLRQGETVGTAAARVDAHYRTVQRWLAWYRQGGLEAIQERQHGGGRRATNLMTLAEDNRQLARNLTEAQDRIARLEARLELGEGEHAVDAIDDSVGRERADVRAPSTTFRLLPDETLPFAIQRLADEQVGKAIWYLTTPGVDHDKAVHEARKSFKRTRAVLRLVRDEIGTKKFTRENARYREASRALSELRSSAVMPDILLELCRRSDGDLTSDDVVDLQRALVTMHEDTIRISILEGGRLLAVAAMVQNEHRLRELPVKRKNFKYLHQGVLRVYHRGQSAMRHTRKDPSTERFHAWRKRVKYLRYQVRILIPLWPGPLEALALELDDLSSILGREHDLAELQMMLQLNTSLPVDEELLNHLNTHIYRQRKALQQDAWHSGRRIYAESPSSFADRLQTFWRSYRIK